MIVGIGTDIVAVQRLRDAAHRHPGRFFAKALTAEELAELPGEEPMQSRFLARRWAAKEAFAKAWGTGVRGALTLQSVGVTHDAQGKPALIFAEPFASEFAARNVCAHLSISDEADYAVAFVILEQRT